MFQEDTETADCWGSVQSFLYLTASFSESLECGRTLRDTHCCFCSHYPWQTTNLQKIDEVQSWPRRPGTVLIRQLLLQHILSLTPSILFTACFHTEEEQSRSHRTRENHVAPCPPARRAVLKTMKYTVSLHSNPGSCVVAQQDTSVGMSVLTCRIWNIVKELQEDVQSWEQTVQPSQTWVFTNTKSYAAQCPEWEHVQHLFLWCGQ